MHRFRSRHWCCHADAGICPGRRLFLGGYAGLVGKAALKRLSWIILSIAVVACAPEKGSVSWCKIMDGGPKSEWSLDDGVTYAKYCLVSDLAIGSDKWCERLESKPKGDWTADEVASYARHCVMKMPQQSGE